MAILECKNIKKTYKTKNIITEALKGVNFSVEKGEFISIMGESGAGKTTLLNIIATLDRATSGVLSLNGKDISTLKSGEIARFRRKELGFVFQDFNLLDQFGNRDNIYLPLVLSEENLSLMEDRLNEIKDRLGISELLDKYPYEISGGQKQRIAIARAIITKPSLLLADEPTGALDSTSSEMILNLFRQVNEDGQTVLVVTHSLRAASYAKRVLFIKDGIVFHEIYRGENEAQGDFMERISQAEFMLGRGKKL
ncbi:ABC transporter, ATP-binding protein [Lachnoanaerobaculum saburreum F0468]|uniref:ABC transporter, ATP-binding protein n=2 Tax=Lachnoanaerobaculum saburreum TaxID=467210 RepID=I0RAX8_9FIRM|nr:ABC transporter ATP-binding protein [Lachnoanaerobaculum saburreum]EIC96836.1 ABC transporter, ATP-binding protein [Lachnoanaerobaculum saburreum F0468]RKW53672.1 MAG: ABC transporter ATP-binding protein [Lachnospiraceae bacterium]